VTVFGTKRFYLFAISLIYLISICFAAIFDLNVFAEAGATLVVISIWRGTQTIKALDWSGSNLSELATIGQRTTLKWDATVAMIGTTTNGYSVWLFLAVKTLGAIGT
jgi:hypothetical protein